MLSREERLIAAVEYLSTREDMPAFARHIRELMRAADADGGTPDELAKIIEESMGLTTAILRRANSAAVNRTGRRVASVRRAITLLGCFTVRDLAAGFLLHEHFQQKTPTVRDLILRSTFTANTARELARGADLGQLEEAYVCGMFRQLGQFLIASYLPELYHEIQLRSVASTDDIDRISREVMQFTFDEIGQRVARHWNLHDYIIRCISRTPPAAGASVAARLHCVAAFAHSVTDALHLIRPEETREELVRLCDRYEGALDIRFDVLPALIRTALHETREVWRQGTGGVDFTRVERQLELACETPTASAAPPAEKPAESAPTRFSQFALPGPQVHTFG